MSIYCQICSSLAFSERRCWSVKLWNNIDTANTSSVKKKKKMLGFSWLLIPSAVVGSPEQQCSANRNPLSSSLAFSHGQVILTWSHVSIFLHFQLTHFALQMYAYREKHSLAAESLGIHCHIHPFPWQQNYFRSSYCYIYFRHLSADLFSSSVWSDQNSLQ